MYIYIYVGICILMALATHPVLSETPPFHDRHRTMRGHVTQPLADWKPWRRRTSRVLGTMICLLYQASLQHLRLWRCAVSTRPWFLSILFGGVLLPKHQNVGLFHTYCYFNSWWNWQVDRPRSLRHPVKGWRKRQGIGWQWILKLMVFLKMFPHRTLLLWRGLALAALATPGGAGGRRLWHLARHNTTCEPLRHHSTWGCRPHLVNGLCLSYMCDYVCI